MIKPGKAIFEMSERIEIDSYDIFLGALKGYKDIGIVVATEDIDSE